VRVIASIHDQLQAAPRDDNCVNLSNYLEELGRSLEGSVRELRPITVAFQVEPIDAAADKACSLGLIVNELVTNALKYAFDGEAIGRVEVALVRDAEQLELSVADNGKGCPEGAAEDLGNATRSSAGRAVGRQAPPAEHQDWLPGFSSASDPCHCIAVSANLVVQHARGWPCSISYATTLA